MPNLPQRKPKQDKNSPSAFNVICHDCFGLRSSISQQQNHLFLKTADCNELFFFEFAKRIRFKKNLKVNHKKNCFKKNLKVHFQKF